MKVKKITRIKGEGNGELKDKGVRSKTINSRNERNERQRNTANGKSKYAHHAHRHP